MYTMHVFPRTGLSIVSMSFWNVAGVLVHKVLLGMSMIFFLVCDDNRDCETILHFLP